MILDKCFRNKNEEINLYWLFSLFYKLKYLYIINHARYLHPQFQKGSKSWNGVHQFFQEIWNAFEQQMVVKMKSCSWDLLLRGNFFFLIMYEQSPRSVLKKMCSENMQQICRRTPMPKCGFNKVEKQLY